ncbi:MAG TPA: pyocin activator PrtN family protein [Nevskia sp.]|nr:pyocin activator PrtN family protein [Nevskia sp.]
MAMESRAVTTFFALMAEFNTADIPLEKVCSKYFGLELKEACRRASLQRLPVPAFRGGSQKSPWLISAADLAKHIDEQREAAVREWQKMNAA